MLRALLGQVVFHDLGDWLLVGEGHKLLVLRDILPIVDQERLEVIGNRNLDRRAVVKGVLLVAIVSIVLPETQIYRR